MTEPTVIEALEEAIRMLQAIADGRATCVTGIEFRARLEGLKAARDAHLHAERAAEDYRARLRELRAKTRALGHA